MSKDFIISGLDIGSTAVRIVVAQVTEDGLNVMAAVESPAEGVNRGVVNSIEDAVSSISQALEQAERLSGFPIESVFVSVSGPHIISQDSRGVVAVGRADGEIRDDDVDRVIEAAQAVASPPNYEIIHVIPRSFVVDNQPGIKDPVGMTGVRLEVDAQIIQGLSTQINNLTRCIYRTGVDIDDLVLGILATAEAVLDKRQKELGTVVINIGGTTTSLAVFEEGDILHAAVLPVGSSHITNDIAIGLRISVDTAEQLKVNFGTCDPSAASKKQDIDLTDLSDLETGKISQKQLADIIGARVEEIFSLVDEELKKIDRAGLLPAGAVLTGGGAKLPGMVEAAKKHLRLPASIGTASDFISVIDKANDLSFSTALGLVKWGVSASAQNKSRGFSLGKIAPKNIMQSIKGLFNRFIP